MSKLQQIKQRGPLWLLPLLLTVAVMRALAGKWRVIWAKLNGIKVQGRLYLGAGVQWVNPQRITLATGVSVAKGVRFWSELAAGKLDVREGVLIARNCVIDFSGGLTLEKGVLISEGAIVYTHDHGLDPRSKPSGTPLVVEEAAWIATQAIILPSVQRIGKGAVIAAGAVVSRDVGDYMVCVGSENKSFRRKDVA